MKILSPEHTHLDFSWAKLPDSARNTLALIAAALALSSVLALCALLLFSQAAHAGEHKARAATQAAAPLSRL